MRSMMEGGGRTRNAKDKNAGKVSVPPRRRGSRVPITTAACLTLDPRLRGGTSTG
jgi:hypothetical protein